MKVIEVHEVSTQHTYHRCVVCRHLRTEIYEIEETKTYICDDCVEIIDHTPSALEK